MLGAMVYIVALSWSYQEFVYPHYDYLGYTNNHPGAILLAFSWIAAWIPSLWMPAALRRPSQVVYWLLYLLVLVPACLIPAYTTSLEAFRLVLLMLSVVVAFGLLGCIYRLPLLRWPRLKLSRAAFWVLVILVSLGLYAYVISVFGFHLDIINLTSVYEVRTEYKNVLATRGIVLPYAINWLTQVLNPLFIAEGLTSRNPLILTVGVVGQLMVYSITGFKEALFSPGLAIALLMALRGRGRRFGLTMLWGLVALVCIVTGVDWLLNSILLRSVFIRRMIVTTGLVTGHYVEFFTQNPKVFLSHSVLSFLMPYPYPLEPPDLIGLYFYNNPLSHVNGNLWADAFANFGYLGIFAFTVALGAVLLIYDSFAKNRDWRVTALLMGMPGMTLTNSALFTSLLSHGILVAMLLVFLMPPSSVPVNGGSRLA